MFSPYQIRPSLHFFFNINRSTNSNPPTRVLIDWLVHTPGPCPRFTSDLSTVDYLTLTPPYFCQTRIQALRGRDLTIHRQGMHSLSAGDKSESTSSEVSQRWGDESQTASGGWRLGLLGLQVPAPAS